MSTSKSNWLTSFVDLTGLILAYFVLTFSMSDYDSRELTDIAAGFLQKTIGDQQSGDRQAVHALGSSSPQEISDTVSRQMFAHLQHISRSSEGIDVREMNEWISVRFGEVLVDKEAASGVVFNAAHLRILSVIQAHATEVDVLASDPLAARSTWDRLQIQFPEISDVPIFGFRTMPDTGGGSMIFLMR